MRTLGPRSLAAGRLPGANAALVLVLASCILEQTANVKPTVTAGMDVEALSGDSVVLRALGSPAEEIASYAWTVSASPNPGARLDPRGEKGEIAELVTPAGATGIYVVGVTATDLDGLVSDPDYLNVTLKPRSSGITVTLACGDCRTVADKPEADEGATIHLLAQVTGATPTSFSWSASIARSPADSSTGAPVADGTTQAAAIQLPTVFRSATVTAQVVVEFGAARPVTAVLPVAVKNSVDEPPVVAGFFVRRAGQTAELETGATVLVGDALDVEVRATDPNGDAVTCALSDTAPVAIVDRSTAGACRRTVYPLQAGNLVLEMSAGTVTPPASAAALTPRTVPVGAFRLETGALATAALTAVALGDADRAVVADESGTYHVVSGAQRYSFSSGTGARASAAAIVQTATKTLGLVAFGSSATWSQYDFRSGISAANVAFNPAPTGTAAIALGTFGRAFGATDEGVALFDASVDNPPAAGRPLWPSGGGRTITAVAVEAPASPTSSAAHVFYAIGADLHFQSHESTAAWDASLSRAPLASVDGAEISALAAGPSTSADLWVGTRPVTQSQGLFLYQAAFIGALEAPVQLFAEHQGVRAIAVEREGAYAGDAWLVAGNELLRVSRAPVMNEGGQKGAEPLVLTGAWETPGARAVAVWTKGTVRKVAVATGSGLLVAP